MYPKRRDIGPEKSNKKVGKREKNILNQYTEPVQRRIGNGFKVGEESGKGEDSRQFETALHT